MKFKCAVVYGNLPPENRAIQASLFNDKSSGYDVLVASDAVEMGLNLNIQRLSTSIVKQIAGRAGRYGAQYANGIATTFIDSDLNILQEEIEKTIPDLTTAWIQPDASLIERATYLFPTLKLDQVLIMLGTLAVTGPKFSFEFDYNQLQIARMLNPLKIPVDLTMTLLFAPFKVRDEDAFRESYKYVKNINELRITKEILRDTIINNNEIAGLSTHAYLTKAIGESNIKNDKRYEMFKSTDVRFV